jgi:hypothetical protein
MSTDPSPKMTAAGLLRLKRRVARIQKLLDLEAPTSVLVRECRLIAEAGRMIDPTTYFECDRDEWIRAQRFKLSLCTHDDCDAEVAEPIHALDHPSFEHTHCAAHANEMLLDDDAEEEITS